MVFPLLKGLESSFWGQIGVEFNLQSTGAGYRCGGSIRAAHCQLKDHLYVAKSLYVIPDKHNNKILRAVQCRVVVGGAVHYIAVQFSDSTSPLLSTMEADTNWPSSRQL